jgi:hypothetical protein
MQTLLGSPIERRFEERFLDFKANGVAIERQYVIETVCGLFRLDFLICYKDYKIGIECDGQAFHNYEKDFWRDALILGTKRVDDIVRISGTKINYYIDADLYQLGKWFPWMFSGRNLVALEQLAKENFREADNYFRELEEKWEKLSEEIPSFKAPCIDITFDSEDLRNDKFLILRTKHNYYELQINWEQCFQYAALHGSKNLEKVIIDYHKLRKNG